MEKAILYARQSSGDEEQSLSVENQLARCREACERHGWEVVGTFRDLNTSGRTYPSGGRDFAMRDKVFQEWSKGKRKCFRDGLEQALSSDFETIVCYDQTRLFRPLAGSFLETYVMQRLLGRHVETVANGEIDFGTLGGRLLTSITSQIEDDQLKTMRKKAMESIDALKRSGHRVCGKEPFGYDYSKDRKMLVANGNLDAIRRAYSEMLGGESPTAISRHLNALSEGRKWNPLLLRRTLRLPTYAGLMRHKGSLIRLANGEISEVAVSEEVWHRVQTLLDGKSRQKKARKYCFALTGLVFCGYCGRSLRMVSSTAFEGPDKPRGARIHSLDCSMGRCDEDTRLDCSLARVRYSLREPPRVDEDRLEASSEGIFGKMNRSEARLHETFVEPRIQGLYEAISPLLCSIALRDLDGPDPATEASRDRLLEIGRLLPELSKRKAETLALQRDGLASYDDVRETLKTLSERERALEKERQGILETLAGSDADAAQKAANRLASIRRGDLHPTDFRELFLREYERIDAYSSMVVLKRRDGGSIVLQKIFDRSLSGLPPYSIRTDGKEVVVTYFLKSSWKDFEETNGEWSCESIEMPRKVFRTDGLTIQEVGENPAPGAANGFSKMSERTRRRHELWLQESCSWKS